MSHEDRQVAIALRGAKGAGKSTVARILSGTLGWPLVVTGDVVRQWAHDAGGSADAVTVRRLAAEARQTEEGVMGQILYSIWPEGALPKQLIVDSVRETSDVVILREIGYYVALITISAPFEIRLARVRTRDRSDDAFSRNSLRAHDKWERSLGGSLILGDIDIRVRSDRMDKLIARLLQRLRRTGVVDA